MTFRLFHRHRAVCALTAVGAEPPSGDVRRLSFIGDALSHLQPQTGQALTFLIGAEHGRPVTRRFVVSQFDAAELRVDVAVPLRDNSSALWSESLAIGDSVVAQGSRRSGRARRPYRRLGRGWRHAYA